MGIFFLTAFAAAEIVLVVLTFTKFAEKSAWLTNKLIVRSMETVLLLGIIVLPTTYMKWRFICAMIVVFIRFVIAGISWLVRHKKITGIKNKVGTVINCIFSIILTAFTLVPAFVFSNYNGLPLTGDFKVNETNTILVDEQRTDPFENDGSFREVPAHFFYPESNTGNFPLIIFSHGAFGYYQSNFSTYAELASHGYVVVALDHPYHSFFTTDTNGNTIIADTNFINDVMKINETASNEQVFNLSQSWLKIRTDDENFVLDTIKQAKSEQTLSNIWHTDSSDTILHVLSMTDTDKIGLMGHSLGGATGVALGRQRNDIDTVIDLDGTMLGEVITVKDGKNVYYTDPYPIPVLDFTKEQDFDSRRQYEKEHGYPYVNEYVIDNAKDGKTVIFSNAEHMDFTDLPMFSPVFGSMLGHGNVNSEEFMTNVNSIVLNWFDYYLKNEGTLNIQSRY